MMGWSVLERLTRIGVGRGLSKDHTGPQPPAEMGDLACWTGTCTLSFELRSEVEDTGGVC
jgi:hypothetical protein